MFSKPALEGEDDDRRKKAPRYSRVDAKTVPVASVDEISAEIHSSLRCENKKRLVGSVTQIKDELGGCLRQHFLDGESLDAKVTQHIVRLLAFLLRRCYHNITTLLNSCFSQGLCKYIIQTREICRVKNTDETALFASQIYFNSTVNKSEEEGKKGGGAASSSSATAQSAAPSSSSCRNSGTSKSSIVFANADLVQGLSTEERKQIDNLDAMLKSMLSLRNKLLEPDAGAEDFSSTADDPQQEIFCLPALAPARRTTMNYSLPQLGSLHASYSGLCRNCVAFAYGFSPNLFKRASAESTTEVNADEVRYPVAPNIQRLLPLDSNTYFGDTHTLEDIEAIYNANGLDAGNMATMRGSILLYRLLSHYNNNSNLSSVSSVF